MNFCQKKFNFLCWFQKFENFSTFVKFETEFSTANYCPSSFWELEFDHYAESPFDPQSRSFIKSRSAPFRIPAFSRLKKRRFRRFRLISSNSEQIHFLYSDVSSASDDDSEAFFRANKLRTIFKILDKINFNSGIF